ncbi:hypothetical protein [Sphaerisporangium perillae]|uniref:hypothetical protein n=1 Tax=Sphaerisporangium perillae TaxID=2935860 RepID=UPI00200F6ABE|nr:hypothetical protein [Sphaerisporangium perillae]
MARRLSDLFLPQGDVRIPLSEEILLLSPASISPRKETLLPQRFRTSPPAEEILFLVRLGPAIPSAQDIPLLRLESVCLKSGIRLPWGEPTIPPAQDILLFAVGSVCLGGEGLVSREGVGILGCVVVVAWNVVLACRGAVVIGVSAVVVAWKHGHPHRVGVGWAAGVRLVGGLGPPGEAQEE